MIWAKLMHSCTCTRSFFIIAAILDMCALASWPTVLLVDNWFTSYLVWCYQIRRDAIGSRSAISSLLLHGSILTPTKLMINNTPIQRKNLGKQYNTI